MISRVSADIQTDKDSDKSYYVAHIDIAEAELRRLGTLKIVPGMPVEAFLVTGDRNLMSYLLKPLTDQMQRSLRED